MTLEIANIIFTSFVVLVTMMCSFHLRETKKTYWILFSSAIWIYENVPFFYRIGTVDEKWNILQQHEMQYVFGQAKWTIINHTSFHPEKVALYIWLDWKGVFYYDFLSKKETIYLNKYCYWLELKAAKNIQK